MFLSRNPLDLSLAKNVNGERRNGVKERCEMSGSGGEKERGER